MRQTFHHADFEALTRLWNQFYPEKFRIDADLLRQNTVDSPVFDWGVSLIDVDGGEVRGFVAFKRSAAGLFKGPSVDQAHLSSIAFVDPKIAVDLMAEAKRTLANRGVNRIVFGADSRHFFPGCPTEFRALSDFLMVEGFETTGQAHDLERDLADYQPAYPKPDGVDMRPLESEDDIVALRIFLENEFPGRWLHDTMDKLRAEDDPSTVYAAFDGSKVVGFAMIQNWNHKQPIGGGVWRNDLGEKWGTLGPIGVADELRGKGIGHGLLAGALAYQRDLGVRKCIIDWTGLIDFYGRHGFEVTRSYEYSALRIGD